MPASEPHSIGIEVYREEALPGHRLTVFMFTDLLDSSGLKVRLGDIDYATKVARPHNQLFRQALARFPNAREVNYTGDGFYATFGSIVHAVEMALVFQRALHTYQWEAEPARTRIGVHVGEAVILEEKEDAELTMASHAADMCARLTSLGLGGQILLSRQVFDDARQYVRAHPPVVGGPLPELCWAAHGPYLFKGKDDPIEVFEVGAVGFAPLQPPPNADKARRALRPGDEETLGWRPAQGVEIPGRAGWVLVERLGDGGFGEVWLAEHDKLKNRRVFKFCFDEERLRSFKRELTFFRLIRDALGERRDITKLYDVRLEAPPFFLESEFAEHGNLVQWCESQGGVGAVPLERRLEIMAGVADAVAAAHSIGILHKDIKPQNVLMQQRPGEAETPQLTDFGIGVLADRAALAAHEITAAGFTVNTISSSSSASSMTRLYAPPEQLTGKPFTVQGDIFALGVMLYQIVAGDFSRALAAGWERDIADPLLREDIAACVDGDPARRIPSATELAERLRSIEQRREEAAQQREQRRLEEELAAAQALADQERERLRRTRRFAAIIAVLALFAIAAEFSAQKEKVRAQRAEAAAEAEKKQADFHRGLAEKAQERAEKGEAAAQAAKEKAEAARKAADELIQFMQNELHDRLSSIGQLQILDSLNQRIRDYRTKHPPEEGDYGAWRELAIALSQQGDLDFNRGQLKEALDLFRERYAITERLVTRDPKNTQWFRDHWSSYLKIGDVLRAQGKREEALENFRAGLAMAEEMIRKAPTESDSQSSLALTDLKIGDACRDLGKGDEAYKAYYDSLVLRRQGSQRFTKSTQWPRTQATSAIRLGELQYERGKLEDALDAFREALELRQRLLTANPSDADLKSDLCYTDWKIAQVYLRQGKLEEAMKAAQDNLEIRTRLVKQDGENAGWSRELASGNETVGMIAWKQLHWADAADAFTKEIEICRPWVSVKDNRVSWVGYFSNGAAYLWLVVHSAPPEAVSIDRAKMLEDLRTAVAAAKALEDTDRLAAPMDKILPLIEALLQEAEEEEARKPAAKPR